jgi:hypothetical protein
MSVTLDIVESWRHPRLVVRRLLEQGRSEPFAFSLLVNGLILLFVSRTPFLRREALALPETPLAQHLLASALATAATVPFWYLLAALGHLVARALGGKGGYYQGRIALFWALVASSPALLTYGLVQGLTAPSPGSAALGGIAALVFVVFWAVMLHEVERA